MPNKVTWKKGMRLTTEIFNSMDAAHDDTIRHISELASAGRFGLYPSLKPFELSVNVSNNILEVVSLQCYGITRCGQLVDIEFDSNYSNTFDTRVQIPPQIYENESLLLVVRMHESEWREVNEMYSESLYTFELIGENSKIDDNCLPIGCLVNQYGWRLNEIDFVPPCLYISSHRKFEEQLQRAVSLVKGIFTKCLSAQDCVAKDLLASIWNASAFLYQKLDKERETLTPAQLYSLVQQFVGAFLIGCSLDDYVSLENQEPFVLYFQKAYDLKTMYRDIEQGLSLCKEIDIKMNTVYSMTEVRQAPMEQTVPKPKPQSPPEPKSPGKNRWEGIEI